MNENTERLRTLIADPVFGESVRNIGSFEELQKRFEEEGCSIKREALEKLMSSIAESAEAANIGEAELSDEELEQVNGGIFELLAYATLTGGIALVSYGLGWAAGKLAKKKSGVCMR